MIDPIIGLRHGVGIAIVLVAEILSRIAHRMIHAGAWLMDRENEIAVQCITCDERNIPWDDPDDPEAFV